MHQKHKNAATQNTQKKLKPG